MCHHLQCLQIGGLQQVRCWVSLQRRQDDRCLALRYCPLHHWTRPSPFLNTCSRLTLRMARSNGVFLGNAFSRNVQIIETDIDARFFEHYSGFLLGIFDQDQEPESYFNDSTFLFWTIVATGARHSGQDSNLFLHATKEVRDGAFQPMWNITNPIPVILASLILCLWPLPIDTMWKDPSHALAGYAHSLATQIGLYAAGHEQDFSRTRTHVTDKVRVFRAHLWLHCCITFQRYCQSLLPCSEWLLNA